MQERLRQSDKLFRLGGEEFVILLPRAEADQARQLAQELAERLRASALGGVEGVAASFGVAALSGGEKLDDWFKRADDAFYRAKAEGRDRVELAAG